MSGAPRILPWTAALSLALSASAASVAPLLQDAPPELGRAASAPPAAGDPLLDGAVRLLMRGGFREAEELARTALARDAANDRAAAVLGVALSKQKRYTEARAWLERARDSSANFPERRHAAHFLGWCCYHLGDLAAARVAFERHLEAMPDEPDSTFGLGLVALDEDRLDDAERHFTKSLEGFRALARGGAPRGVDEAKVLTRLGDVALRRDDPAGAKRFLEEAIRASAVQHETWSKMARVCDRLGEHAAADAARGNAERILEALGRRERQRADEQGATKESAPESAQEQRP